MSVKLPSINQRQTREDENRDLRAADSVKETDEDQEARSLHIGHRPVDRVLADYDDGERFDAFTSLTLNYVALHQKVAELGHLRDVVQKLAQALEGIPAWRVDSTWSSDHLRETMLRTGLDQVCQTTGGQGFCLLYGQALELRSSKEIGKSPYLWFFSASAQSAYTYMRNCFMEKNEIADNMAVTTLDVAPVFGDVHTPLFKTICNTGMPAVYTWGRLTALSEQKRASIPPHHFKMASVSLLPFGTGSDGVLLGLANGHYPDLIINELTRIMRRFYDGVAASWRRLHEDEIRRRDEALMKKHRNMEQDLAQSFSSTLRDSHDTDVQMEMSCAVLERRFGPTCFIPMVFSEDAQRHGGSTSSGGRGSKRNGAGRSHISAGSSKKSGGSGMRAPVRFDRFVARPAFYVPDGQLRAELLSIAEAPNFPDMGGQVMTKAVPWVAEGQEEIGVFSGALLDRHRSVLFLPIWDEDMPIGLLLMFPAPDMQALQTQQVVQRVLTDHLNNLNAAAAMLDAVFAQAIPAAIVSDVRDGLKFQQKLVRTETDPMRKLALERMPIWSVRADPAMPLYLLQAELADSSGVAQRLSAEARQALYNTLWDEFAIAARKIDPNIVFAKTIGDMCVYLGNLKPVELQRMFDLGLSIHAVTRNVMSSIRDAKMVLTGVSSSEALESFDTDGSNAITFLKQDDLLHNGSLNVEFRAALVSALDGGELLVFVSPTAGQVRLDYAGRAVDYINKFEGTAPPGQGVLTDVKTAHLLPDPDDFRLSKPRSVNLRGTTIELLLVTEGSGRSTAGGLFDKAAAVPKGAPASGEAADLSVAASAAGSPAAGAGAGAAAEEAGTGAKATDDKKAAAAVAAAGFDA
eukprot:TRINITY_DN756_c1_g1_i1.p1 TRINITY_DN756_c1_g1~~TRINITY_DN756_c1_g1_i1.p1  ORF type:complete len:859 (+),score=202.31 TRINITY_DN756_c1_g1_i1:110-2686(+)